MKTFKQILLTILFTALNAVMGAIALKASVGQGAFDAFCNTLSQITPIKVGTWIIIICLSVQVVQILIEVKHKAFTLNMLAATLVPLITGEVVNIIYYGLFNNFEISSYVLRLVLFLTSNIISAFAVAGLLATNFTCYPLEILCQTLEKYTKKDFKFYRQIADIILIVLSISISLISKTPFAIREGTVISMIIFAPFTALFTKFISKFIKY